MLRCAQIRCELNTVTCTRSSVTSHVWLLLQHRSADSLRSTMSTSSFTENLLLPLVFSTLLYRITHDDSTILDSALQHYQANSLIFICTNRSSPLLPSSLPLQDGIFKAFLMIIPQNVNDLDLKICEGKSSRYSTVQHVCFLVRTNSLCVHFKSFRAMKLISDSHLHPSISHHSFRSSSTIILYSLHSQSKEDIRTVCRRSCGQNVGKRYTGSALS